MRLLIKTVLILAALFASTFLIIKMLGIFSIEDIQNSFTALQAQPSYVIGSLVVVLLFADLFIAVPTMSVVILGAFFLGFTPAFFYSFLGLMLASFTGYMISRFWGNSLLNKIVKDAEQRYEMERIFRQHGIVVLILSRAAPILPEVSACMSGISKMPVKQFITGWLLGSIPYLLILVYAGSISTLDNPYPAILAALFVSSLLWVSGGILFYKKRLKT